MKLSFKNYNLFGEFKDRQFEKEYLDELWTHNKQYFFITYNICCVLLLLAGVFRDYKRDFLWGSANQLLTLRIILVIVGILMYPIFFKKEKFPKAYHEYGLGVMLLSSIIILLLNLMTGGSSQTMLPGILVLSMSYYLVVPNRVFYAALPSVLQLINFTFFYDSSKTGMGHHGYMVFMLVCINALMIMFKVILNFNARKTFLMTKLHRESAKAKDTILGIIGHDLKSPLTVINLKSYLIKAHIENGNTEKAIANVEKIEQAGKNLNDLLSSLLEWAMDNREKNAAPMTESNVKNSIERAIKYSEELARNKAVELESEIEDMAFSFDSNMLETSIRNILVNAIKYTPSEKKVKVKSYQADKKYVIEIKDEGEGMSEELVSKILKGVNKDSTQGTDGEKGTGLGLNLALQFIHHNNGTLDIDSQLGLGSTFKIFFNL
jgi:signal transduction histidine kinase